MIGTSKKRESVAPAVAAGLAAVYLVSANSAPALLAAVSVLAAAAACTPVLLGRCSRPIAAVSLALGAWLAIGFAATWWLRSVTLTGLWWIVLVLFAAPLPLLPWLYSRSFSTDHGPLTTDHASSSSGHGSLTTDHAVSPRHKPTPPAYPAAGGTE